MKLAQDGIQLQRIQAAQFLPEPEESFELLLRQTSEHGKVGIDVFVLVEVLSQRQGRGFVQKLVPVLLDSHYGQKIIQLGAGSVEALIVFVRQVQQNFVFTIGRNLLVRSLHQLQSSGRGFRLAFRHHPDFRASRKIDRQVRIERHFAQKVAKGTMPQFPGGAVAQFRSVAEQFIKLRGAGSVQGEEFLVDRVQFAKRVEIRQELTVILIRSE